MSEKRSANEKVPVSGVEGLKGKYRQTIRSDWDDLEERGEESVERNER